MTEQQLREELARATTDVPAGPAIAVSIRAGRRRRRTTRAGVALAAVAVVGVGFVGVRALTGPEDSPTVAADQAAPAATDFVPGTTTDEELAAVIAEHLPALPAPDDVYPSDSHTAGPLPDADWASAEDWQAVYTVDGRRVLVIVGSAAEPFSCEGCAATSTDLGTVYEQSYDVDGATRRGVWSPRADGSAVGLLEDGGQPRLDPDAVVALVQDPRLTF